MLATADQFETFDAFDADFSATPPPPHAPLAAAMPSFDADFGNGFADFGGPASSSGEIDTGFDAAFGEEASAAASRETQGLVEDLDGLLTGDRRIQNGLIGELDSPGELIIPTLELELDIDGEEGDDTEVWGQGANI